MLVNSISSLNSSNAGALIANNAQKSIVVDSQNFGSANMISRKARAMTAAVAMMPYVLGGIAASSVLTLNACHHTTMDTEKPVVLQRSPVQTELLNLLDVLGLESSSEDGPSRGVYNMLSGDVVGIALPVTIAKDTTALKFILDEKMSTDDKLTFRFKDDPDNIYTKISKIDNGVRVRLAEVGDELDFSFISQDGGVYMYANLKDKKGEDYLMPMAKIMPNDAHSVKVKVYGSKPIIVPVNVETAE